jgi:hypothetical protein
MIDLNAALCHHLFELPIADWIGHIPSDAPQDDIALELAAFEIDHGCRTGRLFPVSLRALGKVSKFATEPYGAASCIEHTLCVVGLVPDPERRAVLRPHFTPVVEPCRRNIRVAKPLLDLGDVGLTRERVGVPRPA